MWCLIWCCSIGRGLTCPNDLLQRAREGGIQTTAAAIRLLRELNEDSTELNKLAFNLDALVQAYSNQSAKPVPTWVNLVDKQ